MVHGLEKFKEYFHDHANQYIFIGGTACDILMDELGAPFRATKDLDMVLSAILLNDVFRLLANVTPSSKFETAEEIKNDVIQFIELIKEDKPDLRNLGIRGTSLDELLGILGDIFLQRSET